MTRLISFVTAALLVAIYSMAVSAQNWDDIVATAKKERELTVYNGFGGGDEFKEINALFQKRYGITVKMLEGRGSEIAERV